MASVESLPTPTVALSTGAPVTLITPGAPVGPKECPICLDNLDKLRRSKRVILTLPCGHIYCRKCIVGYAREEIQNRSEVLCPNPTCEHVLTLKGLIDQKLLKKARQRSRRSNACPTTRCLGTVVDFECNTCHLTMCQECGEIQHTGRDCRPEIRESYRHIHLESRKCPHCQVPIEKDGGCNHVTCWRCNTAFDWMTLRTYDEIMAGAPPRRSPEAPALAWNPGGPPIPGITGIREPRTRDDGMPPLIPLIETPNPGQPVIRAVPDPQPCRTCQRLCLSPTGECCRCHGGGVTTCQLCQN
jgi:hypothetical protein